MAQEKVKLGKREVDRLVREMKAQPAADRTIWDSQVSGYGLRFQNGKATFTLVYRRRSDGKKRRYTIGTVGDLTPDQAREIAARKRVEVAAGSDPAGEKRQAREQARRDAAGSVAALCELFIASGEGPRGPLKPGTLRLYRQLVKDHVVRVLGDRPTATLTRQDVRLLRSSVAGNSAANRAVRCLAAAWHWGQQRGHVDEGRPFPSVEALRENKQRGCSLTVDELRRLGAALERHDGPAADALRVYLLSGCRPQDIVGARWRDLHQDGRRIKLADSKTGARMAYLGTVPAAIIARQPGPRDPDALIFNVDYGKLDRLWRKVKADAGLDKSIRAYDSGRHSFTSRAYEFPGEPTPNNPKPLPISFPEHLVRRIVGATVADFGGGAHGRYRHPSTDQLLGVADAVSLSLWRDLSGDVGSETLANAS